MWQLVDPWAGPRQSEAPHPFVCAWNLHPAFLPAPRSCPRTQRESDPVLKPCGPCMWLSPTKASVETLRLGSGMEIICYICPGQASSVSYSLHLSPAPPEWWPLSSISSCPARPVATFRSQPGSSQGCEPTLGVEQARRLSRWTLGRRCLWVNPEMTGNHCWWGVVALVAATCGPLCGYGNIWGTPAASVHSPEGLSELTVREDPGEQRPGGGGSVVPDCGNRWIPEPCDP